MDKDELAKEELKYHFKNAEIMSFLFLVMAILFVGLDVPLACKLVFAAAEIATMFLAVGMEIRYAFLCMKRMKASARR